LGDQYRDRLREVTLPLDPIDTQTVLFASATLDVARPPREVEATLREGPAGWLTGLIEGGLAG
jgi:hypothetical protein